MSSAANAASAPLRSLLSRLTIKGPERSAASCSELLACASGGAGADSAGAAATPPCPPLPSSSPLREALDEIRALRLPGAASGKEDVALAHAIERRRAILRGEKRGQLFALPVSEGEEGEWWLVTRPAPDQSSRLPRPFRPRARARSIFLLRRPPSDTNNTQPSPEAGKACGSGAAPSSQSPSPPPSSAVAAAATITNGGGGMAPPGAAATTLEAGAPGAGFKTPRFAPSRLTAALAAARQQQRLQQLQQSPPLGVPADAALDGAAATGANDRAERGEADAAAAAAAAAPSVAAAPPIGNNNNHDLLCPASAAAAASLAASLAGKRPRRGSLDVASREGHEPPAKAALPPASASAGAEPASPSSPLAAAAAALAAADAAAALAAEAEGAIASQRRVPAPRPAGLAAPAPGAGGPPAVEGPPTPPPTSGAGSLQQHEQAAADGSPSPRASSPADADARALATWSGPLRQRVGGPRSPLVAELCRLSLAAPALVAGALPPVLEIARLVPRRGVALGRHLVLRAALSDDVRPRQRAGLATLASAQLVAVVPLPSLDALAPPPDEEDEEGGGGGGGGGGGNNGSPPRAGSALHLVPYVDSAGCAQLVGFLSLPWLHEGNTSSASDGPEDEDGSGGGGCGGQ